MKTRLIISGIAGILASLALPMPRNEPVSRRATKVSGPTPSRTVKPAAAVTPRGWPVDAATIAKLPADECGDALDRLLRHCACALPDGETLDAAVALTLRLIDLSAAKDPERNPVLGRQVPSWLLHKVTSTLLANATALPDGWMRAVAQSAAGREAMLKLTTELAVSSREKAIALASACPATWREDLSAKIREGIVLRDPVAAAREAWESAAPHSESRRRAGAWRPTGSVIGERSPNTATPKDHRHEVLMLASRKGPVKEAVAAITLYGEGGPDDTEQQRMLANLLQRDEAATRAAVEESDDPGLRKMLAKAELLPAENEGALTSPADLVAKLRQNPARVDPGQRQKAWQSLAALDPDQAATLWNESKHDIPKRWSWRDAAPEAATGREIAEGMAAVDPEKAFHWAKANAPDGLMPAFSAWVQADGPAALQAVWSLPPDNRLREQVERIVGMPEHSGYSHISGVWMNIPWDGINSAARYVKTPEPPGVPPTNTPRETKPPDSTSASSLWNDGPLLGR
jgi:hypothetical protein